MTTSYNKEKLLSDLPTTSSECKELLRFYARLISSASNQDDSNRLIDSLEEIISHLRYRYIIYEQISDDESLTFILYYENHYPDFVLPHHLLVERDNNVDGIELHSESSVEPEHEDALLTSIVTPSDEVIEDGSPEIQDYEIVPLPQAPMCVESWSDDDDEVCSDVAPVRELVPVVDITVRDYASGVFQHQIPSLTFHDVLNYSNLWSRVNSEDHEIELERLFINYELADFVFHISDSCPSAVEILSSYGIDGYMSNNVLLLYDKHLHLEDEFNSDVEDDDIKLQPSTLRDIALRSDNRRFLESL